MTMTDQQYRAERASIDEMWAGLPGMTAALIADLDKAFEAANAPVASTASPHAPNVRESTVPDIEPRIKGIVEATGVTRAEAQRRVALADGTLDIEQMTAAELRQHIATNYAGEMSYTREGGDERSLDQLHADMRAGKEAEQEEVRAASEWGAGLYDRMDAKAAEKVTRAIAERTREAAIRGIVDSNPHISREEAGTYAPSIESLVGIAKTIRQPSGVEQARADLRREYDVLHPADGE